MILGLILVYLVALLALGWFLIRAPEGEEDAAGFRVTASAGAGPQGTLVEAGRAE